MLIGEGHHRLFDNLVAEKEELGSQDEPFDSLVPDVAVGSDNDGYGHRRGRKAL